MIHDDTYVYFDTAQLIVIMMTDRMNFVKMLYNFLLNDVQVDL